MNISKIPWGEKETFWSEVVWAIKAHYKNRYYSKRRVVMCDIGQSHQQLCFVN